MVRFKAPGDHIHVPHRVKATDDGGQHPPPRDPQVPGLTWPMGASLARVMPPSVPSSVVFYPKSPNLLAVRLRLEPLQHDSRSKPRVERFVTRRATPRLEVVLVTAQTCWWLSEANWMALRINASNRKWTTDMLTLGSSQPHSLQRERRLETLCQSCC